MSPLPPIATELLRYGMRRKGHTSRQQLLRLYGGLGCTSRDRSVSLAGTAVLSHILTDTTGSLVIELWLRILLIMRLPKMGSAQWHALQFPSRYCLHHLLLHQLSPKIMPADNP